jgi:hypothetical protein
MLHMPGSFVLSDIPVGTYYLLAAAFPHSNDPHTYLLPSSDVLVSIQGPLIVEDHDVLPIEVQMRPWKVTDPPIVSALPFL